MEILPHRPPMLLVDEILEMDENHVVGALHLTGDEFFFQGHFPGNPIMPAVFRLEALAQAGGVALLSLPEFKGKTAVYTGIDLSLIHIWSFIVVTSFFKSYKISIAHFAALHKGKRRES